MTNKENQIELISRGAERVFELEDLVFQYIEWESGMGVINKLFPTKYQVQFVLY